MPEVTTAIDGRAPWGSTPGYPAPTVTSGSDGLLSVHTAGIWGPLQGVARLHKVFCAVSQDD